MSRGHNFSEKKNQHNIDLENTGLLPPYPLLHEVVLCDFFFFFLSADLCLTMVLNL